MSDFDLKLKTVAGQRLLGKSYTGPYWELEATVTACYLWAKEHPESLAGLMRIFYFDNPKEVTPEKCRSFVGIPVKPEITAPAGFEVRDEPEQTMISVVFKGPQYSKEKYKAYQALYQWITQNQEQYAYSGEPLMEIYLNSLEQVSESELLTDICLPVKKI